MSTQRDMPEAWSRNARTRSNEITAAIVKARQARAEQAPVERPDELARRRAARRAAEEARRRFLPTDPPGPRTA